MAGRPHFGVDGTMQTTLRFLPGVAAAAVAFVVTKFFAWTELGFEFGAFLTAYLAVAVSVDRGMKRYGVSSG